jgi:hypothetical protein
MLLLQRQDPRTLTNGEPTCGGGVGIHWNLTHEVRAGLEGVKGSHRPLTLLDAESREIDATGAQHAQDPSGGCEGLAVRPQLLKDIIELGCDGSDVLAKDVLGHDEWPRNLPTSETLHRSLVLLRDSPRVRSACNVQQGFE